MNGRESWLGSSCTDPTPCGWRAKRARTLTTRWSARCPKASTPAIVAGAWSRVSPPPLRRPSLPEEQTPNNGSGCSPIRYRKQHGEREEESGVSPTSSTMSSKTTKQPTPTLHVPSQPLEPSTPTSCRQALNHSMFYRARLRHDLWSTESTAVVLPPAVAVGRQPLTDRDTHDSPNRIGDSHTHPDHHSVGCSERPSRRLGTRLDVPLRLERSADRPRRRLWAPTVAGLVLCGRWSARSDRCADCIDTTVAATAKRSQCRSYRVRYARSLRVFRSDGSACTG